MNRHMSLTAAVLMLTGASGLAMQSASAQSLSGGSYTFNQSQCVSGANGTLICSGAPMAITTTPGAPVGQAGVGASSPVLTSGAGIVPETVYGYEAPSGSNFDEELNLNEHEYLRTGEPGSMQCSTCGGE